MSAPLNIIFLECDHGHGEMIRRYLLALSADQFNVRVLTSTGELGSVRDEEVDVILVDFTTNRERRNAWMERARARFATLPLIDLNQSNSEIVVGGMTNLENQFQPVPVNSFALMRGLGHLLQTDVLGDQINELKVKVGELSRVDPVTGLSKRALFVDRLREEVLGGQRYGTPLAVSVFEVQEHARLSMDYGDQAPDIIMGGLGALIRELKRDTDICALYSPDSFCFAYLKSTLPQAKVSIDRTMSALESRVFSTKTAANFTVKFCVGAVQLGPTHASVEALLLALDEALARSRERGPGTVELDLEGVAEEKPPPRKDYW